MKLTTTLTLTTALFLMSCEPATTAGMVALGAIIIALLGIGAYTSNKVRL